MTEIMKEMLLAAVDEYGVSQNILSTKELQKKWSKCVAEGTAIIPEATDIRMRTSIIGLGTILKEDLKKHVYVTTINVDSFNEALLVCRLEDNNLSLIACAHEGIIQQHIAEKAVTLVLNRIQKMFPVNATQEKS